MVSRIMLLIVSFFALTLVSASAGLWVFNSHIAPLKDLAGKPSLSEVLDKVESLKYTMIFGNKSLNVEVKVDPASKSGVIILELQEGSRREFQFNYTKHAITWLAEKMENGSLAPLNPLEYYEAFATNINFIQTPEGTIIGVEAFPGIAPVYALTYIGNATYIDWSTLYNPRAHTPAWVGYKYANVELSGSSIRGVELLIQPQSAQFMPAFKWYQIAVYAKLASIKGVPVAAELIIQTPTPQGGLETLTIKVEEIKIR